MFLFDSVLLAKVSVARRKRARNLFLAASTHFLGTDSKRRSSKIFAIDGRSIALNVIDKRGEETGLDSERFERKMEKGLAERSEAGEKEKTQS